MTTGNHCITYCNNITGILWENHTWKSYVQYISTDSQKHAALLKSLRKAVEGPTPFISEQERDKIAKGIEAHIKMEEEAVKTYGELTEKSDNDQVKTIAMMIREDELRHHALLKELHKTMIEPETLTEDMEGLTLQTTFLGAE